MDSAALGRGEVLMSVVWVALMAAQCRGDSWVQSEAGQMTTKDTCVSMRTGCCRCAWECFGCGGQCLQSNTVSSLLWEKKRQDTWRPRELMLKNLEK